MGRTTMATTTMTTTMSLHFSTSRNFMRTTTAKATRPTEPYPMASLTDMAGVTEEGTLTEEATATTEVTDTATGVTAVDTTPTSPGTAANTTVPTLRTSLDTGLNITEL